ncbi:MAG: prephenate dehydrogenase [Terriglobia bacterium]
MSSSSDFFERAAIIGTGLIGGSWGLALRRSGFRGVRIGCDRPEVLKKALNAGAISSGEEDLRRAVANADLVILATPVGGILRLLDQLKNALPVGALITDVGSTKVMICQKARENFNGEPLFLGGHPLAGKECSGIENAAPELFENAAYILTLDSPRIANDPRVKALSSLVASFGARPVVMDAVSHDRAMASLSHLPQLASTALASMIEEREDLPLDLAASGFRDATRLAGSPYAVWRDICSSNQENIQQALNSLISKLETLRNHLTDEVLEREFKQAQQLYETVKERQ